MCMYFKPKFKRKNWFNMKLPCHKIINNDKTIINTKHSNPPCDLGMGVN